jgi:hypothetical protein
MRLNVNLRVLVVALALSACGPPPPPPPPPPGTLTVQLTPLPVSVPQLTLSTVTMHITDIAAIGDRPPPGAPPPPPIEVQLDALSTAGASVALTVPPGLYSRVLLVVESVTVHGSWRGTPLTAQLGMFGGGLVDLRSTTGVEVGAGENGAFMITVDPGVWFANGVLDSAMVTNNMIVCDQQNNPNIAAQLISRVTMSFSLH